jgi:hypothetical protein
VNEIHDLEPSTPATNRTTPCSTCSPPVSFRQVSVQRSSSMTRTQWHPGPGSASVNAVAEERPGSLKLRGSVSSTAVRTLPASVRNAGEICDLQLLFLVARKCLYHAQTWSCWLGLRDTSVAKCTLTHEQRPGQRPARIQCPGRPAVKVAEHWLERDRGLGERTARSLLKKTERDK